MDFRPSPRPFAARAAHCLGLAALCASLVLSPAPASAQQTQARTPAEQKALEAALARSIAQEVAKKEAEAKKGAMTNALPEPGPVEALFRERKYQDALLEADKLKGSKVGGDPKNEYWAARALRSLKRYADASKRLKGIQANNKGSKDPFVERSYIEEPVMRLAPLKGDVRNEQQKKVAVGVGKDLMSVGQRFAAEGSPDNASRAFYIAGNSWRMAKLDDDALTAYEACTALKGLDEGNEYGLKCYQARGVIAARRFDVETAKRMYTTCMGMDKGRGFKTAERCRKDRSRMDTINTPAPDFDIETWLNSEPVTMSELRGKVTLIFFFATWCPHCKEALPRLPDLVAPYEGKGFQMMAITHNTRGQTTPQAKLFVSDPKWKIDYPAAVDNLGNTSIGMAATGIPTAVLIDKKGTIRWSGHPNYLMQGMLDKLMAE